MIQYYYSIVAVYKLSFKLLIVTSISISEYVPGFKFGSVATSSRNNSINCVASGGVKLNIFSQSKIKFSINLSE